MSEKYALYRGEAPMTLPSTMKFVMQEAFRLDAAVYVHNAHDIYDGHVQFRAGYSIRKVDSPND